MSGIAGTKACDHPNRVGMKTKRQSIFWYNSKAKHYDQPTQKTNKKASLPMLEFQLLSHANCVLTPQTPLFQPPMHLSDLLLKILALPVCTLGKVRDQLNPAKLVTYEALSGKWNNAFQVKMVKFHKKGSTACDKSCLLFFELGSTWLINICPTNEQIDTFFSSFCSFFLFWELLSSKVSEQQHFKLHCDTGITCCDHK